MLDPNFIYVAATLNFVGSLGYIRDMLLGKATPNRVTWFLWALAPLVAFAAQMSEGVGLEALMTFMVGFGPLLVFLISFTSGHAEWKLTRFDVICGICSLLGLGLWAMTREADAAILFAIVADALAALPTLKKAAIAPETESYPVFLLGTIGATITLLAVEVWSFTTVAFPIYIFTVCGLLVLLIKFRLGIRLLSLLGQ